MKDVDTEFLSRAQYDLRITEDGLNTSVASIATRTIQDKTSCADDIYQTISIPEEFRIDAKPFINRPFYVGSMTFSTTNARFTPLTCPFSRLPGDLIRSNKTLLNGMKIGSMYRSKCKLNVSMAGTITHAGCVLVGIVPPMNFSMPTRSQPFLINTILSGPHAFLHANEATSALLSVPWYCNTDLATLDMESSSGYVTSADITDINGNYATLVAIVLNPLQPSTGSSNTLTIIVEAIFENLDVVVPTPRYVTWTAQSLVSIGSGLADSAARYVKKLSGDAIDAARTAFREYTGLHNPNTAAINDVMLVVDHNRQNNVDSTQYFETLDPYTHRSRVVETPIFNTSVDEMMVSHVISKRQFLGTFTVNVNDPVGTRLWVRPISPFQGGASKMAPGIGEASYRSNNIELMHLLSRAWKGTIKIYIQSVMNNKQQVKLRLLQLYNPSVKASSGYPVYQDILQAPSHLMEFTAGGQEQIVTLPCLSRNDLVPCSRESSCEALFHGTYNIFVAQPMANSSDSPVDIRFNVYMSLEKDFNFYGYSTELVKVLGPVYSPAPTTTRESEEFKPESLDVMNEPQSQVDNVTSNMSTVFTTDRLNPITHFRDLVRRMYITNKGQATTQLASDQTLIYNYNLSDFYGETNTAEAVSVCQAISSMYYGKTGGLKMRIEVITIPTTSSPVQPIRVTAMHYPPNYFVSAATNQILGCKVYVPPLTPLIAMYPVPFTSMPVSQNQSNTVLEFVIPNNSLYKFFGSPAKMNATPETAVRESTSDLGVLHLDIYNPSMQAVKINIRMIVGFTDETRLGFHSICPLIQTPFNPGSGLYTPYQGALNNPNSAPDEEPNPFLYWTRS